MAYVEKHEPQSQLVQALPVLPANPVVDGELASPIDEKTKSTLDVSVPASLGTDLDPGQEQTPSQKRTELLRFITLLGCSFLMGWQDGTMGPILPKIREHYGLGYTEITSLFVVQCCGAAFASVSVIFALDKMGFGTVLVCGAALHAIATAIQASAPPFPLFAAASFLIGVGNSFQGSTCNGYVAALKRNGERKMGILHAGYGCGAFVAPLVSTQFAEFTGRKWAWMYIVTTCIATSMGGVLSLVFRFKRVEQLLAETNEPQLNPGSAEGRDKPGAAFKAILKMPLVHLFAVFCLLYIGTEVTIGGWIVTFIINERGGGPDAGYISSGFFGGLMLGRLILLPINALEKRRVVFLYVLLTIALDIIVWRVPSLVGNAVAVSIMGMLLGPWFPIVMRQGGLVLPPKVVTGALGFIAGFGIIGGAVVPTITGALSSKFEIKVMPIVVLVMCSIMFMLWGVAVATARKTKLD